jgi:hypothetical protein
MKMDKKTIGVFLVLAFGVAYFANLLPLSVFPIDSTAYVGQPFHIRFFSGTYEIMHSGNCQGYPAAGQGFLVENIRITDDDTGEVFTQIPRNGVMSCASTSYQWADLAFTPLYAHHYTIVSEVKDGTSNTILNTDTWPIQVQTSGTTECSAGQVKCDLASTPDRLVMCDASGHYTTWGDFCPAGCSGAVGSAVCNQVCAPGAYKCTSSAQYQYCKADGSNWNDAVICPYTFPLPTSCIEGQNSPCVQASPVCGDGICSSGEATCTADCGGSGAVCGDGICAAGENCQPDCNVCYDDPATMDAGTFCGCFPTATQCQNKIPDWMIAAGIVGGLALVGLIIYKVVKK